MEPFGNGFGVLLLIGLAIFFGLLGGKLTNRVRMPAVVGYILAGLVLGPSVLHLFNGATLDALDPLNDLALGLVAFVIGAELQWPVLKRMGRGIVIIVLAESFGAFLVVFGTVLWLTHSVPMALIFGALAPASAPAGTVVVLQEYRARGPLTNALLAVVGLDDGLAIMIYGFAAAMAHAILAGHNALSLHSALLKPLSEIAASLLLGLAVGMILSWIGARLRDRKDRIILITATVMICSGLADLLQVSLILANLVVGMVATNTFMLRDRHGLDLVNTFTGPIFVAFFVLAGAHLRLSLLPQMGLLGILYILARSVGLIGGAAFGSWASRAPAIIRKYLGLGILSQAGVAVGLAILVVERFSGLGQEGKHLALLAINTIAATTIVFEIIGPITTKIAITRAGEVGKST